MAADLRRLYDPDRSDLSTDGPVEVADSRVTVKLFEHDSEFRRQLKVAFATQLIDEVEWKICPLDGCTFRFREDEESDPVLRMLAHGYLHLAFDSSPKVRLAALAQIREITDPSKTRVTEGRARLGVLSPEERELLQLEDDET
jgi:hypothetical protein